jgi:hypothetical protein
MYPKVNMDKLELWKTLKPKKYKIVEESKIMVYKNKDKVDFSNLVFA